MVSVSRDRDIFFQQGRLIFLYVGEPKSDGRLQGFPTKNAPHPLVSIHTRDPRDDESGAAVSCLDGHFFEVRSRGTASLMAIHFQCFQ